MPTLTTLVEYSEHAPADTRDAIAALEAVGVPYTDPHVFVVADFYMGLVALNELRGELSEFDYAAPDMLVYLVRDDVA